MNKARSFSALAVALCTASLTSFAASPGGYPQRPIRLIIPFAPGGTADFSGRIVGEGLKKQRGQEVIADNRSGAGSVLGTKLAAEAAPDGYTLIVNNIGLAVNETLRPDRGYVALKALSPVSLVGVTPSVLVVNKDTPYRSVKDLIEAAKAAPGKISYGSAGTGSSTHLSMEYFQSLAGIRMLHVPYKGGGPAVAAMMGGEVKAVMAPVPTAMPHLKAGRIRALAVTGSERSPLLPDLPTIAQAGVPGYSYTTWYGVLAPAGTPKAIIDRLNGAIRAALKSPDTAAKMEKVGLDPKPTTPKEFRDLITAEIAKWKKVIVAAGIK